MKAQNLTIYRAAGKWFGNFEIPVDAVKTAQDIADRFHDKEIDVDIRRHIERRTLTANAYFHVLVNKLAGVMRTSNDEMKRWLVRQYGTVAEVDGRAVEILLPRGTSPTDYYPYCEWLGSSGEFDRYALLKQTHVLNGSEFARLIDGTVAECKAMGIETLSADELRRLYASADKSNSDPEKR